MWRVGEKVGEEKRLVAGVCCVCARLPEEGDSLLPPLIPLVARDLKSMAEFETLALT